MENQKAKLEQIIAKQYGKQRNELYLHIYLDEVGKISNIKNRDW